MSMKIRLDKLRALAVPFHAKAASGRSSTNAVLVPIGPSCSRWFSCTCCHRQTTTQAEFFSPTSTPAPLSKVPPQTPLLPHDDSATPTHNSIHYPLPPPLPYSPNSIPFQRQLEVLSLTVTSADPDESWNVYQGIHISLRSHIPNTTYRLFLEKQLSISETGVGEERDDPVRWARASGLLRSALDHGKDIADLGRECVHGSLEAGLAVLAAFKSTDMRSDIKLVRVLWTTTTRIAKGNFSRIPVDLQRDWLRFLLTRYRRGRRKDPKRMKEMWSTVDEMSSSGLTKGYQEEVGEILLLNRGLDVFVQTQNLKRIVIYLSKGGELGDEVMCDWVELVHEAARNAETSGISKEDEPILLVEKILHIAIKALEGQRALPPAVEYLHRGLSHAQRKYPSLQHRFQSLLDNRKPLAKEVVQTGMFILDDDRRGRGIRHVDMAIAVLDKGLKSKYGRTYPQLVERICEVIEGMVDGRHAPAEADRFIRDLAETMDDDKVLLRTDPVILLRLLRLIVRIPLDRQSVHHLFRPLDPADLTSSATQDPLISLLSHTRLSGALRRTSRNPNPFYPAYHLSRRIYPIIRANHPEPLWTESNTPLWQALFRISLYAGSTQLAFTSRLYADYQSDGLPIPEPEAIAMVHAITVAPPSTRAILLERHIKDYEYAGYEDKGKLVMYLISGLCHRGNTNDASLAFTLSRQILGDRPFIYEYARPIIETLIARPTQQNHLRSVEVLKSATMTDTQCLGLYNSMIHPLVSRLPRVPRGDTMTRQEGLTFALALYKDMLVRVIPDERTVSFLIEGLMKAGYDDEALGMAKAALRGGVRVFAFRIAGLTLRLLERRRLGDAEGLMRVWHQMKAKREGAVGVDQVGEDVWPGKEGMREEKKGEMSILGTMASIRVAKGEVVDWEEMADRYGYNISPRMKDLCKTLEDRLKDEQAVEGVTTSSTPAREQSRQEEHEEGVSLASGYRASAWQL